MEYVTCTLSELNMIEDSKYFSITINFSDGVFITGYTNHFEVVENMATNCEGAEVFITPCDSTYEAEKWSQLLVDRKSSLPN